MYTLFEALAMLSLYSFVKAVQTRQRKFWVGYTLTTLVSAYTHYFTVFYVVVQGVFLMAVTASRWVAARRQKPITLIDKKVWLEFVLSLLSILALYLPWLPFALARNQGGGLRQDFVSVLTHTLRELGGGQMTALPYVFGGLFLWGLVVCWLTKQTEQGLLLGLWGVLPMLLVYLFLSRVQSFFAVRYIIVILPVYLLVVSRGITGLGKLLKRLAERWLTVSKHHVQATLAFAFLAFGMPGIAPLRYYYAWEKEDWRGAAQYLQEVLQDGDLILCDGMFYGGGGDAWRAVQSISYYLKGQGRDNLVLGADSDLNLSYVENARQDKKVWGVLYRKTTLANIQAAESRAVIIDFKDVSIVRLRNPSSDLEQDVMAMFDTFILLQPLSSAKFDLYLSKTKLYIRQARFADADRAIQMAITVNPSDDQSIKALQSVYVYWGQTMREQGEYQQAIRKYLGALKLAPASVSIYINLGFSYMKLGQMDEAVSHLREALAIEPDSYWAHHLMGSWYRLKGMSNEAIAEYQRALEIDPTLPGLLYLMALVYEQQGQCNEAITALERYIETDPDGPHLADAQKRLSYLKVGSE